MRANRKNNAPFPGRLAIFATHAEDLKEELKMLAAMALVQQACLKIVHITDKTPDTEHLEEMVSVLNYSKITIEVKKSATMAKGFYIYLDHDTSDFLTRYASVKNSMKSFGDIRTIQEAKKQVKI